MTGDHAEKIAELERKLKQTVGELAQKNRTLEIEAALELVRARTITMRKSAELSETSALLFHQLNKLGIHALRTGVGIFDEPNEAMEVWVTSGSRGNEVLQVLDYFSLQIHPVFANIIPARSQGKSHSLTILKGQEVVEYYQTMTTYLDHGLNQSYHPEEFFYSFFFDQGAINVITNQRLTDESCSIMVRFAQVFGLIYTRFLDLKKAEEQTVEALRQTSLQRVRAEIGSMRTADDLKRITPLVWNELVKLGVPIIRCGVFIVSEEEQVVHAYLSTPEGKSLGVLHLPFESSLETTKNIVDNWRKRKVYTEYWNHEQFNKWVNTMVEMGQIDDIEKFSFRETPIESLNLQFTPFDSGMLYVGSHYPLDNDQIQLLRSLADTFSVAYARYKDFKNLEDAKNRVEATLSELKATQSQLIQSEKMASLGELTAGIAHEIQNPLNFVNNFSEVNNELIEELRRELAGGSKLSAEEILNDIKSNSEKINHHGKRADAIVKSMLQHSRSSSGQKEPTDINALCDEYLRLSYHGLRAKDKTFNAKFETHFDSSLEKINVVPQEIGRVILNLINNAFYAVNERAKREPADVKGDSSHASPFTSHYEPTVIVSTEKLGSTIAISVKDNGPGIPDSIKEKIFQPFFTTKPTGHGTGLGLSLSYDIITKGHRGKLEVHSTPETGTEFIIILPNE
jgi:signal transduction histidine kinase